MKQHPIFQNTNIWHRDLINRTVVAPMSRVSATADGLATEEGLLFRICNWRICGNHYRGHLHRCIR